jgi:hypothetical protein
MENNRFGKIIISTHNNKCFYHVLGDRVEFYDLESLVYSHPELSDLINLQKHSIEGEYFKKRERINFNDKF